jgi:hypothetical protein
MAPGMRPRGWTTPLYNRSMDLYTCPARTHGANAPIIKHPCGVAAQALEKAGHIYAVKVVGGFKNVPFSRRGKREKIIEMTRQQDVPVLVLDSGTVIQGSAAIVDWASSNPASRS